MTETELVRRIIDFSFIIKGQLVSRETELLRSILNVVIMEAEDVLEEIETTEPRSPRKAG
jgi:hypothetical protein